MTGVNYAGRQGVRDQLDQRLHVRVRHESLKPAGRIKIGTNVQLRDRDHRHARTRRCISAESTNHEVVIIDSKDNSIERVAERGPLPWGTHIMDSKDNYCH